VPLALLADQRFPPGSRERAVWSAGSLVCGVLLLAAGQAWAVAMLKRMNERVGWSDMPSPLFVWGLTLRRLPATAWPLGLGGSGRDDRPPTDRARWDRRRHSRQCGAVARTGACHDARRPTGLRRHRAQRVESEARSAGSPEQARSHASAGGRAEPGCRLGEAG